MTTIADLLGQFVSVQHRYVLEHGREVSCRVEPIGRRRSNGCHGNAAQLSGRWPARYTWWTGYALDGEFGMVFEHSWVQRDDEHLEVTLDVPAAGYFGVHVDDERRALALLGGGHPIETIAWNSVDRGLFAD